MEPGETDVSALEREVQEETGLHVEIGALAGTVDRPGPDGVTYEIRDYYATPVGGTLTSGDDAADARWCTGDDLARLPLTSGLLDTLTSWKALPR